MRQKRLEKVFEPKGMTTHNYKRFIPRKAPIRKRPESFYSIKGSSFVSVTLRNYMKDLRKIEREVQTSPSKTSCGFVEAEQWGSILDEGKSGTECGEVNAQVSIFRDISCRLERIKIFSLVFSILGHKAIRVVEIARRNEEQTMTESLPSKDSKS
jgi:hypothetical protein